MNQTTLPEEMKESLPTPEPGHPAPPAKPLPDYKDLLKKILILLLIVLIGLLSFTFAADHAMSVKTHEKTIASIDEKKDVVMALTASSTLASALVSAIPDDTATPISDKLADLSGYFLLVLCVLYAEKYLITVFGLLAFRILIPIGCVLLCVSLFRPGLWRQIGLKILICSLLAYAAIPASIGVSNMIYATYNESINQTIEQAEAFSSEAEKLPTEDLSLWDSIKGSFTSIKDSASRILNRFVEAVAVMVVTSCVIPILVFLFFVWLIKFTTGLEIPVRPIKVSRYLHRGDKPALPEGRLEE